MPRQVRPFSKGSGRHAIPKGRLPGWDPKEIVYSKYSFKMNAGRLELSASPSSCVAPGADIDAFIRDRINQVPPVCTVERRRQPPYPAESTPLDVLVDGRQAYIVIELDRTLGWQFRANGVAVTTKKMSLKHCELQHVAKAGYLLPQDMPGEPECRIAYFTVLARGDGERQHINLHVELVQDGYPPLEIMIDPDVPNTGGSFPIAGRRGVRSR